DDGRARVLRNKQPAEAFMPTEGPQCRRIDEERRAKSVQHSIHGNGATRRQRHLGGGNRPEGGIIHRSLPKEDIGAVAPQYFVDSLRIVAEPCTDGLHGYLLRRDLAQIDQYPARTCKALAGLCRIGDAKAPAIGHSQACGSLHVDEKGVHPVGQPGDLQPAACKRAALYLAPVEIFNQPPIRGSAGEGKIWVKSGRTVAAVYIDKVRRARQQGHCKCGRASRRSYHLRLVETGDEAGCVFALENPGRDEKTLEKVSCVESIRLRNGSRRSVSFRKGAELDAKRPGAIGFLLSMEGRAAEGGIGFTLVIRFPSGKIGERTGS